MFINWYRYVFLNFYCLFYVMILIAAVETTAVVTTTAVITTTVVTTSVTTITAEITATSTDVSGIYRCKNAGYCYTDLKIKRNIYII